MPRTVDADEVLRQAGARRQTALTIIEDLDLLGCWRRYGDPVVVGAVACGLVVAPDIDIEVHCDRPAIADGFALLSRWAEHPRVLAARFVNALDTPDLGLYWQLRYRHADGEVWKVDMWSVARDHPGPLGKDLVEPMARALTPETRVAILRLKRALLSASRHDVRSIDVYRAVIDGGVRSGEHLDAWLAEHPAPGLTGWRPQSASPAVHSTDTAAEAS